MTYRTRRHTFMHQLNRIARRARIWAIVQRPIEPPYQAVTQHIGRAY